MAQLETNVSVLTKKLKQDNEELITSYKKIGRKLLLNMKNDEEFSSFVDDEAVANYNTLVEERSQATKDILEIKSTSERLNELDKFKKQVMKSIKDTETSQAKMKIRFSIILYREHKNEVSFASLDNYDEIQDTESTIDNLLLENETFNEEKKDAGFLAKFNLNRKIAGNKLKMSILKRTLEKQISKNADNICEFPMLENLLDLSTVGELKDLYNKIIEQESLKSDLNVKLESIEEEAEILSNRLSDLQDVLSPSKQVNHLTQKVSTIDKEVDELLKNIAVDFLKIFIDDENEIIEKNKEESPDIYQHYAHDIEDILSIRNEITAINFNIEYCDVAKKKEETEYKITVMNNAIASCEEGIKNYQKRIDSLNANIEESSLAIEGMDERLNELKSLIDEKERQ